GWIIEGVAEPGAYEATFSTSTSTAPPDPTDSGYVVTNLVANDAQYNPQLLDPYFTASTGLSIRPAGLGDHFWISNIGGAGAGVASQYVGDVGDTPVYQDSFKIVTIPPTELNPFGFSLPFGLVSNESNDFVITQDHPNGDITAPSKFIFASLLGGISAWTERRNDDGTSDRPLESEVVVDKSGQVFYYGVATTNFESNNRLYATTFISGIEVYDSTFTEITENFEFANPFADKGYQAYNVQNLGGSLFVTYALESPASFGDELIGPGLGRVAEFDFDGNLITTWDDEGFLNAPWGFAEAPDNFGQYSNMLLVSNFGDGTIVAFDPDTREAVDYLRDGNGEAIVIDGLADIVFGNGDSLGETNDLYFAAGSDFGDNIGDGVFGKIEVATDVDTPSLGGDQTFERTDDDDVLVVSGDNNVFNLGNGNNTITARGLDQIVSVGDGDDIISIGSGIVDLGEGTNFVASSADSLTVTGGSGDDTVNQVQGNLIAELGEGNNHITSGNGDDQVTTGSGDDIAYVGDGTNILDLGEGANVVNTVVVQTFLQSFGQTTVTTGSGSDTFILGAGPGILTVTNFDQSDRFELVGVNTDLTALNFNDIALTQDGNDTVITLVGSVLLPEDVIAILQNVDASTVTAQNFGSDVLPSPGASIDFESGFTVGDIVSDQIDGLTVEVAGELEAMIFDTANPTGGDKDLESDALGNVLIISEDGDSVDPDDNAKGGTLMFDWDGAVNVDSVGLLDIEESGGTVTLYGADDTSVLATIDIPGLADNSYQSLNIGATDVGKMDVFLVGSGAIAEIALGSTEAAV
ncbi:MAG: TIGR03118 family protein, partial [Cyanobacteria bacterium P01_F01_bin.150]